MNKDEISKIFNDLLIGLDFFSEFTPSEMRGWPKKLTALIERKIELDKDNAIQRQVDQVLALGGGFKNFTFSHDGETIIVENGIWKVDRKQPKNPNELKVGEIYLIPDDAGNLVPIKYNGGRQNKLFTKFVKEGGNLEDARIKNSQSHSTSTSEDEELKSKVEEIRRAAAEE